MARLSCGIQQSFWSGSQTSKTILTQICSNVRNLEADARPSASIFKTDRHKGTVRGLAWNTLQPSIFASGATDAEVSFSKI